MRSQLSKSISFVFLFLLLFPLAEKGIHAFEHNQDTHCTITDKHFHQLEHECSICDFTISGSNELPDNSISFVITAIDFTFHSLKKGIIVSHAHIHLPSRAPPVA